ncbi:MAG: hypothetical protein SGILL_004582 [Bacillariaceae sp.]
MMFKFFHAFAILGVGCLLPHKTFAQLPGGCENFFTSGYNIETPESVNFYKFDTFITLAQAGTYIGPDAVFEYVGFATSNSPFFETDEVVLRVPQFVGFGPDPKDETDDTSLCQFTVGFLSRSQLAAPFAEDGNVVMERTTFLKFFWDPMNSKVDHIYVNYDDDFLDYFFSQLDTVATDGLICQVYTDLTRCGEIIMPTGTTPLSCIAQLSQLPNVQQGTYIDGKSKACRVLHSVFAGSGVPGANSLHCPHINFEEQVDPKGLVKCQDGAEARVRPEDLFTASDFEIWEEFKETVFGAWAEEDSMVIVGDTEAGKICSRGFALYNGRCRQLCTCAYKLGIDPTISDSVEVCLDKDTCLDEW